MSTGSVAVKVGLLSVAIPALGFAFGWALQAIISGCKCDTGAGCHSCAGLNDLIAFLLFGGFSGALLAAFTVLPACLLLAIVLSFLSKPEVKTSRAVSTGVDAIASALESYRSGVAVTAQCAACGETLQVKPKESQRGETLRVKCSCGKSTGTYEFTSRGA